MRSNVLSSSVVPTWSLDKTNLNEHDLEVLKKLNFPHVIKQGRVAMCRINKNRVGGVFGKKEVLNINDIKYGQTTKTVAVHQTASLTYKAENYDTAKQRQEAQQKLARVKKTMKFEQYYIDGSGADAEVQSLLSLFSNPKPTPNMASPTVVIEKETEKEAEPIEPTVKKLSNIYKGKAKEMYQNNSSAAEIAEALGVEQERVINYLKTL